MSFLNSLYLSHTHTHAHKQTTKTLLLEDLKVVGLIPAQEKLNIYF